MVENSCSQNLSVYVKDLVISFKTETDRNPHKNGWKHYANAIKRRIGLPMTTWVEAIRGVSFVVHEGQSVGLIGTNGAGKSTLLRAIAGGEVPVSGKILVNSQPQLLGVDANLIGYLSGRDNIRLGLLALGFKPSQIPEKMELIADFADIGAALDRPMSTYSSGMRARLRFAISTASRPRILLVDEALSTGDATFAKKSERVANDLLADASTVFVVSHSSATIRKMCARAIWIENGLLVADGASSEVTALYDEWTALIADRKFADADEILSQAVTQYGGSADALTQIRR